MWEELIRVDVYLLYMNCGHIRKKKEKKRDADTHHVLVQVRRNKTKRGKRRKIT